MKKIITVLFSVLMLSAGFAQGIQFFEGSFEEALVQAEKENKLVFVDAYTTWCGPCKYMSRDVFTDESVGSYFNSKFINLKLDQEEGEGLEFAKTYEVRFYPTLLFINAEGKLAHKAIGAKDVKQFMQLGTDANSKQGQLLWLQTQHNSGKLSPKLLNNYANALQSARLPESEEIALDYLKTQNNWGSDENINFILKHFPSDVEGKVFKYILKEKDLFVNMLGDAKILDKNINLSISKTLDAKGDLSDKEIDEFYESFYPKSWEKEAENYKVSILEKSKLDKDKDEFIARKISFIEKYGSDNWGELNGFAWRIYEESEDRAQLEAAKKLAKQSIELDENYYNTDTYTWICVKLGDIDSAMKFGEKAKKLGQAEDADVSELIKFLTTPRK